MCVVRCCCRFPRQLEVAKELPAPGICVLLRLCAWYRRRWGRRRSFELEEFLKGGEAKVSLVLTRYYLAKEILVFFKRNCMKTIYWDHLLRCPWISFKLNLKTLGRVPAIRSSRGVHHNHLKVVSMVMLWAQSSAGSLNRIWIWSFRDVKVLRLETRCYPLLSRRVGNSFGIVGQGDESAVLILSEWFEIFLLGSRVEVSLTIFKM